MRIILLSIFIISLSFGCEQIVDLSYRPERKICLNCVLNPDSIVNLSLYYSRNLSGTGEFEPVKDAVVEFSENGKPWGTAINYSEGTYRLNKNPVVGKTYSVSCKSTGTSVLTAETIIPEKPDITAVIKSKEKNPGWNYSPSSQFYKLEVDYQLNDQTGKDYYWNYSLKWYEHAKKYNYTSIQTYASPYIDDFNRIIDSEKKYGFYYEYYARLTDIGIDGEQLTFTKEMTTKTIDVFFNADEHYDKYMKTSIQQKIIDNQDLPFKEPVQIYSNIQNGTGIFGSASFTYLNYHK